MGGKCKQIDISTHTQTQTIFVYLSIEVKPSMAVMTPFHTSTNTIYLGWVLVSCWGAFVALNISCLLSVSVYLIESPLCLFTENDKKPKGIRFFFNAVNFLYKNFPTLWSGQASVLMSFFCFPSFEREGDSRLDRVDERTTIYQMAHCVFLFLGSLTLLNIEMRHQLGFSGKKCEISWSQCIDLSPSALDWRNGLKNCQGKKNVMKQIWNPYD